MKGGTCLVCGGRDFKDQQLVDSTLDIFSPDRIIQGGARGADDLARRWAISRGVAVLEFHAMWDLHGSAAGPIRNQQMLTVGKPDYVIAFPGGRGTADMIKRARKAGIQVIQVAP